jgi:predicted DNA-binding transcriptional regulator
MSKSKTNTLAFIVNQKGSFLTSSEKAVINYIASFSKDMHKDQRLIAIDLGISIRTFQRAVTNLIKYGLLKRFYRLFKKVTYILVDLKIQIKIIENIARNGIQTARNFIDKIRDNVSKTSRKSSVMTPVTDIITTLVSQPTKENKFKENNIINIERKEDLEQKRQRSVIFLKSLMMNNS